MLQREGVAPTDLSADPGIAGRQGIVRVTAMSQAADQVRVETSDGVGVLRLDRPKMNALNADIQRRIGEAATQLDERSDVAAVVLTGGEQVFAAGADIKEMATMTYADMVRHSAALQDAFSAVARIGKPVVAAVFRNDARSLVTATA